MTRHLLEIDDLSAEELLQVLDRCTAAQPVRVLHGRGAALIFEKPSNRTRNSTEMAVVELGGHPIYLTPGEVDIDGMERMSQFQLLCFKLQTLLAQIEAQTSPEGVDQINQAFAASLVPLKRRIDDLRDPSQRQLSLEHYRHLAGDDVDNPFATSS